MDQTLFEDLVQSLKEAKANKKDTHFNCLNKQHSLNSCPWPAPNI